MNKTDYNKSVVDRINNKIGILQTELTNLHNDNSIDGLRKRLDLMISIATLYEILKKD